VNPIWVIFGSSKTIYMKKLLPIAAALLSPFALSAQTTLFSENFNGNQHQFTLNTADMSSATNGYNLWTVNNSYTGGTGSLTCMSFTFNYSVGNTAQQPSQIAGNPTSNYMHILSQEAISDGITCGSYFAADGFCNMAEMNFTRMTNDISTVGYANTTLSFWWLCGGSTNGYGEVYYSTDGGITWTAVSGQYLNAAGAWQQQTVYDSNFDNKPTLRFGFRFVNNTTTSAADPGFCIDDVLITGDQSTGVPSGATLETLTAFPNPASDVLHLNFNLNAQQDDQVYITITDITGAVVRRESYNYATMIDISTAELTAGCYFLTAEAGETKSLVRFAVTR
jgi:hypothetical protein